MQKTGYRIITGKIYLVSGLRIGGSDDQLEIGGTDLTCIKHPVTRQPYIPGSSLKGKLRSELEMKVGKFGGKERNEPCGCAKEDCLVCRLFGPHKNTKHNLGPSRIVVRDAALLKGGETELKAENVIDRKTGTAQHPRKFERVVSGSEFTFKIGIQVWDIDSSCVFGQEKGDEAFVAFVIEGLRLVQRTGLGSGVSKGSGEIEFRELELDGVSFSL